MNSYFYDSSIMFKRSIIKTLRSGEAMAMAIIVPIFMMVMFGYVFGGVVDLGEINYINFIVPGIIVQCVVNAATTTAYNIHTDMTTGIIDRFRSMSISSAALLSGHVWVSVLRSVVISIFTTGAAFAIGFRPSAGIIDWLLIFAILFLFIVAMTWLVVVFGLVAKETESISGLGFLLMIFVFLSSAFSPTETLPLVLRVFAQNQPITHVIDALRALMLGLPVGNMVITAILWCIGLTICTFLLAVKIYKSKL